MDEISAIDIAAVTGLTAVVLLTLNILMGVLVSTNYQPARHWPHRKLPWPLFRIHNWTGYLAMAVAALHPTILLASRTAKFTVASIVWPLASPGQRNYNVLGALALYGFALVVATSYFRPQLRHRRWKKLHYTAYFAAACMFLHGTLIDQNLKGQTPDFLDGEKLLVEGCLAVVIAAGVWRARRGTERARYRAKSSL